MRSSFRLPFGIVGLVATLGAGRASTPAPAAAQPQVCQDLAALNAGGAKPCVYAGRRAGTVRLVNRTFVDDQGPFLGLGATLFWAHWGFIHDRPKLEAHLKFLAGKVDYIRVIVVCWWPERTVTIEDVLGRESVRGLADLAYDKYGIRLEPTLFSGDGPSTAPQREAVIRHVAAQLRDRGHKIQHYEIANEGWNTGFSDKLTEIKRLADLLRELTPNAVATTALPLFQDGSGVRDWYGGSQANLATVHLDRNVTGDGGLWRPAHQAGDVPNIWPGAWTSNEPIGPRSSVASDDDPLRLTMSAAIAWMANGAGYVLHTGAGQTAGATYDRARSREPTLMQVPNLVEAFAGIRAVRALLPADLPGWSFQVANRRAGPNHPFVTSPHLEEAQASRRMLGAFAAVNGRRFVVMPLVVKQPLPLVATAAMSFTVHDPMKAGAPPLHTVKLQAGDTWRLPPTDAVVILGQFL
jgi:hypothetical protein